MEKVEEINQICSIRRMLVEDFVDKVAYDVCNLENSVFFTLYDASNAEIKFSNKHTSYVLPFFLFSLQHTSQLRQKSSREGFIRRML